MIESETNAITIGLFCAVAFGFCILVASVLTVVFGKRKANPYDQAGKRIHPADDPWDEWDLAERYNRERRGKK